MKLVYITNTINGTTGLERMIVLQTNYFIEHYNYEIHLILLEQNQKQQQNFFTLNPKISINYLDIKNKGLLRFYSKIKTLNKAVNDINPDIIVVCENDIFGLYLPVFIKSKYRSVYQRHNTKTINLDRSKSNLKVKLFNEIKKLLIKYAGKSYDSFVLLSEAHRADWGKLNNLSVISNPMIIDTKNQRAALDNKTVLAVGRHDPVKGFDMLLKCWVKVLEKHPDWKLNIVGKKTHDIDLKGLTKDLGIEKDVVFKEHTKDIASVYLESSLFVCSSTLEGFPLVMIEAMSFGLPVVSFDCTYGPREIINDSDDGILVPQNDISILANSIIDLIENKEKRSKFGENASLNIQRFSMDNIMPKWKLLFESLI